MKSEWEWELRSMLLHVVSLSRKGDDSHGKWGSIGLLPNRWVSNNSQIPDDVVVNVRWKEFEWYQKHGYYHLCRMISACQHVPTAIFYSLISGRENLYPLLESLAHVPPMIGSSRYLHARPSPTIECHPEYRVLPGHQHQKAITAAHICENTPGIRASDTEAGNGSIQRSGFHCSASSPQMSRLKLAPRTATMMKVFIGTETSCRMVPSLPTRGFDGGKTRSLLALHQHQQIRGVWTS